MLRSTKNALVVAITTVLAVGCSSDKPTSPDAAALNVTGVSTELEPQPAAVAVGDTLRMYESMPSNSITWSSSDTRIATVNRRGLVRGIARGTVTITAKAPRRTQTGTVTVFERVTGGGSDTTGTDTTGTGGGTDTTGTGGGTDTTGTGGGTDTTGTGGGTDTTGTGGGTQPPPTGTADTIFYEGFESGSFSVWDDGYTSSKHRILTDAGARVGSRYLQVTSPAGDDGGWLTKFFMPGYDSVYVRYYVRLADNWQGGTKFLGLYGNRTDNQWSGFGQAGVCSNGTNFFNAMVVTEPAGGNPPPMRFYTYHVGQSEDGCYGEYGTTKGARYTPDGFTLTRGRWHKIEFWLRINDIGQTNGVQRYWVNDTLRAEWNGIRFRTSTILRINAVQLSFNQAFGAPQTQMTYVDDLLVSTTKPADGGSPPPPPPAPAPVASVTVSPSASTLTVGQGTQLTATLRDASGNVLTGRSVAWQSSNGSAAGVSSSGYVTAMSAGTATIVATSEGRSGTASITVQSAPAPAPVATVTVTPSTSTIQPGQTVQLTATARDASGNALSGRVITWQTSNPSAATVSSSGLVTGQAPGSAMISATSEGRSGTSAITVSALTGGGGTSGTSYANEPAGLRVHTATAWNSLVPSGWAYANRTSLARIVTDLTAPASPSSVLEYFYPAGYPGGGEPAVHEVNLAGTTEVFVGFHFKFTSNWQGHASGINKLVNVWPRGGTAGLYWLVFRGIGETDTDGTITNGPYYLEATLPQGPDVSGCALTYGGAPGANVRHIQLTPGAWHKVEAHWQARTATSGGRIRWWVDGQLVADFQNLSCAGTAFDYFQIAPTWGGVSGTKSHDDYVRFDDMRLMVK